MDQQVRMILDKFDKRQTRSGNTIFAIYDQYGTELITWDEPIWQHAIQFHRQPIITTYQDRPSKNPSFPPSKVFSAVALDNGAQAPVIAQAPDPEPDLPPAAQPSLPPAMNFPAQTASTAQPVATAQPVGAWGVQPIPVAQQEYQRPKHPDEQDAIWRSVALQCAVAALPNLDVEIKPALALAVAEMWYGWLKGEKIAAPQSEIL